MKLEQALQIVEELVQAHKGRGLSHADKLVLLAAWEDRHYKDVALNSPFTTSHLQRYIGAEMWRFLTEHLGKGEQITKKNFRWFLEQGFTNHSLASGSPQILLDRRIALSSEGPCILGGQPPSVSNFYGRVPMLALLRETLKEDRCVVLTGPVGIGKSALAAKLIEDMLIDPQPGFDTYIWKSIHYAPPFSALVNELIRLLVPGTTEAELSQDCQERTTLLIELLKSRRTLLVLDAAEAILQGQPMNLINPYGKFAEYGDFIRRVIEEQHQSCLMLTSREPFTEVSEAQDKGHRASCISVEGLGKEALHILQEKELQDEEEWGDLIAKYRGNPLALRMVASRIQRFFGGSVKEFREYDTTLMNDMFKASLDELFGEEGRLSPLEKKVVGLVAQAQEAVPFKDLLHELKQRESATSVSGLIEALEALEDRSLIEKVESEDGPLLYTVQPVVRKYVLTRQSEPVNASLHMV